MVCFGLEPGATRADDRAMPPPRFTTGPGAQVVHASLLSFASLMHQCEYYRR